MKLSLKSGEHIRIKSDGAASFVVYVEHGLIHITAQPKFQPTRVVLSDENANVENAHSAD